MPLQHIPADVGADAQFLDTSVPRKGLYDYIIVGGMFRYPLAATPESM